MQKRLLKNKLIINLNAIDPFIQQKNTTYTLGPNFEWTNIQNTNTKNFKITVAYILGNATKNKKAQLIFVSHDTNLLRKDIFRRDQIWFAEKDKIGATDLYSLVEYKVNQATVRNDASFEKDYLLGKYGAIPFLGDIQKFIIDFFHE